MTTSPHTIFIIPYRDRAIHKAKFQEFFEQLKNFKGWNDSDVRAVYAHQCDNRLFNRGATKNIGFLAMKQEYPNDWQDITFVFHDVDSIPTTPDLFKYETTHGVVTHYYGFTYTLGGMFAIKGRDFESTGGFPNLWGWGIEDNVMQDRVLANNLSINRLEFIPVDDKRIMRPFDGYTRTTSNREVAMYKYGEHLDNMHNISSISFNCVDEYVNIMDFRTSRIPEQEEMNLIDLRNKSSTKLKVNRNFFRKRWGMQF